MCLEIEKQVRNESRYAIECAVFSFLLIDDKEMCKNDAET